MIRLAAVLALSASPVWAQQTPCAERDQIVARLADRYNETLQSMGMHANGGLLEVYAAGPGGTWTILITRPDGTTCMVAAGKMFEGNVKAMPDGPEL